MKQLSLCGHSSLQTGSARHSLPQHGALQARPLPVPAPCSAHGLQGPGLLCSPLPWCCAAYFQVSDQISLQQGFSDRPVRADSLSTVYVLLGIYLNSCVFYLFVFLFTL